MRIFITGATGFIGQALLSALLAKGYHISALSRNVAQARQMFPQVDWYDDLEVFSCFDEFEAVINLAGEPIFSRFWTAKQKECLRQSRWQLTEQLVRKINQSTPVPRVFISASASGVYADGGTSWITEKTPLFGQHFTAELCRQWEAIALTARTRVCVLRSAMVFGESGGAFPAMMRLYQWGLGGRIASGHQYWSWISLQDMVAGIIFLLQHSSCRGVFNFCSPTPLTNQALTQILSQHLRCGTYFHTPTFVLKCLLGERHQLLTQSLRMMPEKLLKAGFHFQHSDFTAFLSTLHLPKKET